MKNENDMIKCNDEFFLSVEVEGRGEKIRKSCSNRVCYMGFAK